MANNVATVAQVVASAGSNTVSVGGGSSPPTTGQLWPRKT